MEGVGDNSSSFTDLLLQGGGQSSNPRKQQQQMSNSQTGGNNAQSRPLYRSNSQSNNNYAKPPPFPPTSVPSFAQMNNVSNPSQNPTHTRSISQPAFLQGNPFGESNTNLPPLTPTAFSLKRETAASPSLSDPDVAMDEHPIPSPRPPVSPFSADSHSRPDASRTGDVLPPRKGGHRRAHSEIPRQVSWDRVGKGVKKEAEWDRDGDLNMEVGVEGAGAAGSRYNRAKRGVNAIREQLEGIIRERKIDLLSFLVSNVDDNGESLTHDDIKDNMLLLIFAGHDTSSSTLTVFGGAGTESWVANAVEKEDLAL